MNKTDVINKYLCTTGGALLQLRRIKKDLKFEPCSTYKVSGDVLCNIVQILEDRRE